MKLVSISGIIYKVADPLKSADFYEKLGFIVTKRESDVASIRLNWFWVDLVKSEEKVNPGTGEFTYITVDDVDDVHKQLKAKGFKPLMEPENFSLGRREFVIQDPDGYMLVFFQKK